ncbi:MULTISPECIES: Ig-like domain-containing protein [unclassified Oceanispirochaeta]|uniref:Ig-like domain-containing protein n=1 Tax=unclassified Oceanispirochaeta TaxID=2635722 RepID=UPI001314D6BC|nr:MULTISPECIES: Ig-like domain-containing protein [unclassified Oceanispirochaeta]MBF9016351.1 Ig-like domain-containing protein [Oceanispirochaeta sp. M2]NPD72813.1 hypothetical protein [Oceanispirochaeta sp. M1]
MKKMIIPLIILLLAASCKAPTALLDKLEDDVKAANDLYLEIVSISPDENQLFTNPGEEVRIEFDRTIDMESIAELVKILDAEGDVFGAASDRKTLEYDFDESSNILTIAANPYLDGLEQYTVEIIEGLKGTDGSLLRESMSWSFTTNDDPRGYVEIEDEYSSGTVTVNLFSEGATFYAIATSSDAVNASTDWIAITSNPMEVIGVPIEAVNGETSLYVKFRDGMINEARSANVSRIESASTIHDSIGPVISINWDILYGNIANGGNPTISATVTDSSSGVASISWSEYEGSDVSDEQLNFTNGDTLSATVTTPLTEGEEYEIILTAIDNVGNETSSSPRTIHRDTVAPATPVHTGPSITDVAEENPTSDTLPNYTFSTNSDIVTYQYSINGSSTWRTYPGTTVMSYGNDQTIRFRGIDSAGNASSATVPDADDTYFIYPSSIYPSSGSYLTGDLTWAYSSKAYTSRSYFKAYIGLTSRSQIEIYLNPVYDKFGNLTGADTRLLSYIDKSEFPTLTFGRTYYWRFEVYDSGDEVIFSSPVYTFTGSKFFL